MPLSYAVSRNSQRQRCLNFSLYFDEMDHGCHHHSLMFVLPNSLSITLVLILCLVSNADTIKTHEFLESSVGVVMFCYLSGVPTGQHSQWFGSEQVCCAQGSYAGLIWTFFFMCVYQQQVKRPKARKPRARLWIWMSSCLVRMLVVHQVQGPATFWQTSQLAGLMKWTSKILKVRE